MDFQTLLLSDDQALGELPEIDEQLRADILAAAPIPVLPRFEERGQELLENLEKITERRLISLGQKDGSCSVCLQTFLSILAEEEMAEAMDSPAYGPGQELGVSQLSKGWQCGHLFCRKDIVKWIKEGKDTCPMCRKGLFDPASGPADKPKVIIHGRGTPRLLDFFRQQGIEVEYAPEQTSSGLNALRQRQLQDMYASLLGPMGAAGAFGAPPRESESRDDRDYGGYYS